MGDPGRGETIRVTCPGCGAVMSVPARFAGRKGTCPRCGGAVMIGGAAAAPAPRPEPTPARPAAPRASPPVRRSASPPPRSVPAVPPPGERRRLPAGALIGAGAVFLVAAGATFYAIRDRGGPEIPAPPAGAEVAGEARAPEAAPATVERPPAVQGPVTAKKKDATGKPTAPPVPAPMGLAGRSSR